MRESQNKMTLLRTTNRLTWSLKQLKKILNARSPKKPMKSSTMKIRSRKLKSQLTAAMLMNLRQHSKSLSKILAIKDCNH